jgi:hypothetical protein
MKQLKLAVWACGLAGLVGTFLPFGAADSSFFDSRSENGQTYWVFAGFLIAIALAVMATIRPPFRRWQAIAAAEGFAIVILKFRGGFVDLITDGNTGGRTMAFATLAGLLLAIVAAIKPEPDKHDVRVAESSPAL